jgi:hypothetical protein
MNDKYLVSTEKIYLFSASYELKRFNENIVKQTDVSTESLNSIFEKWRSTMMSRRTRDLQLDEQIVVSAEVGTDF